MATIETEMSVTRTRQEYGRQVEFTVEGGGEMTVIGGKAPPSIEGSLTIRGVRLGLGQLVKVTLTFDEQD